MYEEYDRLVEAGSERAREKAVLEVACSSVFGEQWILRSDDMIPRSRQPPTTGHPQA
jgi:hypothetical protein